MDVTVLQHDVAVSAHMSNYASQEPLTHQQADVSRDRASIVLGDSKAQIVIRLDMEKNFSAQFRVSLHCIPANSSWTGPYPLAKVADILSTSPVKSNSGNRS